MRIDSRHNIDSLPLDRAGRSGDSPQPNSTASSGPVVADLSYSSGSIASFASAALSAPEVRQDKVDSLKQMVQSGQYQVNPQQLASEILSNF
jgi:flagellar biosynthesis anti-sigma factor FlgM